jgi:hypothetical protein
MNALSVKTARITGNVVGEIVLAEVRPIVTRTSALSGCRTDMLQRGYTPTSMVRVADHVVDPRTN